MKLGSSGSAYLHHHRRSLHRGQQFVWRTLAIVLISLAFSSENCTAQIRDSFGGGTTAWILGRNDCSAQIILHQRVAFGGRDGGACEVTSFRASSGRRAEFTYRVAPTEVIEELEVSCWVHATKPGAQLALRVRFPYATDANGEPAAALLVGETYQNAGQWQRLRVSDVMPKMKMQYAVLRSSMGRDVDLRKPYIDAITVNAYTGPGSETIKFDDLQARNALAARMSTPNVRSRESEPSSSTRRTAFAAGKLKRFIEYNGESLEWIRSTGFTGVLLTNVPNDRLLREASRLGLEIIAPAATTTRRELVSLLAPVTAWTLGDSLIERDVESVSADSVKLRRLPAALRREIVLSPSESHHRFRGTGDYLIYDMQPPCRGLTPNEECEYLKEQITNAGRSQGVLIGVASGPVSALRTQLDVLAESVGAEKVDDYGWHATWLQAIRALEFAPRGVIFRSNRPLDSGRPEDRQRADVLRFVNQTYDLIAPLVSGAIPDRQLSCGGASYRAKFLKQREVGLIIATSTSGFSALPRSGDGSVLHVSLPPSVGVDEVWRITGLQLERLQALTSEKGPAVGIVSPDFVELLVVSKDPQNLMQLGRMVRGKASGIAFDRWQLVNNSLARTEVDLQEFINSGLAGIDSTPTAMLHNAASSVKQSDNLFRGNNIASAYRMSRRADAWSARVRTGLAENLAGPAAQLTSRPTLMAPSAVKLHVARLPSLKHGRWNQVDASANPFDNSALWEYAGWTHDRRREDISIVNVQVVDDPDIPGRTQMLLESTSRNGQQLPGGFAGTTVRASSGETPAKRGDWLRISVRLRVSMKERRPYCGVRVYENFGGPELGFFVRPSAGWQNVTLYRVATEDGGLRTTFELMGEGEALIGDLSVSKWQAAVDRTIPFRSMSDTAQSRLIVEPPEGRR